MRKRPEEPIVNPSVDNVAEEKDRPVFNPFSSNRNEEDEQRFKSPSQRSHHSQQSLERE